MTGEPTPERLFVAKLVIVENIWLLLGEELTAG